ncbi:MAG: hypothetical protein ACRDJW_10205 [Thermomicrobiales bacterium]
MAIETSTTDGHGRRPARPRSHLFAVRLWTEEVAGGAEFRGSVRDVVSGAFRGFRDWSDLAAFMIARMEEDEDAQAGSAKGATVWPSEKR